MILLALLAAAAGVSGPVPSKQRHVEHFTIEASGDLLIHSPVWERAAANAHGHGYDFAPMFREIRPYVRRADLPLCHVETPMTGAPPTSYPVFNTPPALARGIARTGWTACDTASNHSVDQHQHGIDHTTKALNRAGVRHTGSFRSAKARRKPLLLRVRGTRLGFLAYTTDTNGLPPPHRWSVNITRLKLIRRDVRRDLRTGADGVVVNVHWGGSAAPEYVSSPSADERGWARKIARIHGVIAVVAQGPHVVQPIRWVAGKPVVLSEGNLVSNQGSAVGLPAATQDGLVALLHFVARGDSIRATKVRYVPTYVRHPDFRVLPVGRALKRRQYDASALRASYRRTVRVAGRSRRVKPVPRRLP
jgi:poly-gamma-glutamate capsule biosynthesis protein CapA/YwtB (metallophosphatase superfamily)